MHRLASIVVVALACKSGGPAAALRPNPELGGRCDAREPLTVEWSAANRGRLESLRSKGLIAVRYHDCKLEVLDCHAQGSYAYVPLTPKDEQVKIKDKSSLYAELPAGAASLEAKLEIKGELDVDMRVVGRFEFERSAIREDELQGDCDGATHVINAMTIGAFKFFAGGSASVASGVKVAGAGAGGASDSSRELLAHDGDAVECSKATAGDKAPPYSCGALLRIELAPIELTAAERCNRAGAKLVSCGAPFDPAWSAKCPTYAGFPSCAKSAGDDCNKLAQCVFKVWGGACVPKGKGTCKAVNQCYAQCAGGGQAVNECNCTCTLSLDPSLSIVLVKQNACYAARCMGKCGATGSPPCNDCFVKQCGQYAQECNAN